MAATQRGRTERDLVKITLSNDFQVLCPIYKSSTTGLGHCTQCARIPEEVYFLSCRHTLCKECFYASTEYVCKFDKKKTPITPGVEGLHTLNFGLQKILLECRICRGVYRYPDIKTHIFTKHLECLEQQREHSSRKKQDVEPRHSTFFDREDASVTKGKCESQDTAYRNLGGRSTATPKSKGEEERTGPNPQHRFESTALSSHHWQDSARQNMADSDSDMLTDDESSGPSLGESRQESRNDEESSEEIVTCRHCITPCTVPEKQAHEENCTEREVNCHKCNKVIKAKDYDEHMETHYRTDQKTNGKEMENAVIGKLLSQSDAKKQVEKIVKESKKSGEDTSMSIEDVDKYSADMKRRREERDERNKIRNEPPATNQTAISKPERDSEGRSENRKQDEPMRTPMPHVMQHDDEEDVKKRKEIMELKNRIKELERRLEDLESPLKALIKRLSEDQQQQRGPPRSTAL